MNKSFILIVLVVLVAGTSAAPWGFMSGIRSFGERLGLVRPVAKPITESPSHHASQSNPVRAIQPAAPAAPLTASGAHSEPLPATAKVPATFSSAPSQSAKSSSASSAVGSTETAASGQVNPVTLASAPKSPAPEPVTEHHGNMFKVVNGKVELAGGVAADKSGLVFNDPKSVFKIDNPNVIVDKKTGNVQFVRDREGNFHKVTVDENGNVALNSQLSMMDHAKIQSRVLTTPSNLIKGTVYTGAALALGALAKNIILNSYNKDTQDDGSTDFMNQVDSVESGSQADASAGGLVDPSVAAGASGVDASLAGSSPSIVDATTVASGMTTSSN